MSDLHVETLENLKEKVETILVTTYDMLPEEAAAIVDESMKHASMWHENAIPDDLAEFLAEDDDDE